MMSNVQPAGCKLLQPLTEKTWLRGCVTLGNLNLNLNLKLGDQKTKSEMAASWFTSLSEENITQLLNDKDSENTKKSMKQHRLIFECYLKEKKIRNPTAAVQLAAVLRKFYAEARKKIGICTQNNYLCSIRFALCRHFKKV